MIAIYRRYMPLSLFAVLLLSLLASGCRLFHGPPEDPGPLSPNAGVEITYEWLRPGTESPGHPPLSPGATAFLLSERRTNGYDHVKGLRLSSTNTVLEMDPSFMPQLGTYHYKVSWRRVGVADAQVVLGQEGDLLTIEIRAGTGRKLDLIYKVRYRGKAVMTVDPLKTVESDFTARVKNRKRHTELEFKDDGDVDMTLTKTKKGKGKSKVETTTLSTSGFALDPLSAACLVRRLDWEIGKDAVFEVVTGKSRYEMHLTCTAREKVKVNGSKRYAWVIVPLLREIDADEDDKKQEQEDNVNKSSIKIYVAADETKDVLKIVGDHKVGSIQAQMEDFEPAPPPVEIPALPAVEPGAS